MANFVNLLKSAATLIETVHKIIRNPVMQQFGFWIKGLFTANPATVAA